MSPIINLLIFGGLAVAMLIMSVMAIILLRVMKPNIPMKNIRVETIK